MRNADMPAMPMFNSNGAPVHWSNGGLENDGVMCGLTKREEFAKEAMKGLLASGATYNGRTDARDLLAADAVAHADALLAELERTK